MSFRTLYSLNIVISYALECDWIQGSSILPRNSMKFAVGSYNDSIFILGGDRQIVEYSDKQFIDIGPTVLDIDVFGYSQFWTQQQEFLYVIEKQSDGTSTFGAFNMRNKEYTSQWKGITFPTSVGDYGCLASSESFLFVVGGFLRRDTLQVLSLSTFQWIEGARSMNTDRTYHACIVSNINSFLWSFGGKGASNLKSNERISITNIIQNQWNYVEPFPKNIYGVKAVEGPDGIYLIGGQDGSNNYLDTVYVMDFNGETLTLAPDPLSYVVNHAGIILVDSDIYVFGGRNPSVLNTFMHCHIFATAYPTEPSHFPSQRPSNVPTKTTNFPSKASSNSPTEIPTAFLNPSAHPSTRPIAITEYIQWSDTSSSQQTVARTPNLAQQEANVVDVLDVLVIIAISALLCVSLVFIVLCLRSKSKVNPPAEMKEMVRHSDIMHAKSVVVKHEPGEYPPDDVDVDEIEMEHDEHDGPVVIAINNKETVSAEEPHPVLDKKAKSNMLEVELWLQYQVNLPQYFDIFVQNGYDRMEIMKEIENVTELKEIGITSEEHQEKLLEAIQKWRAGHVFKENVKREGSVWSQASGARSSSSSSSHRLDTTLGTNK